MAVEPKIINARTLTDLNLAVRYGIVIRICASGKLDWTDFKIMVVIYVDHQTAKFSGYRV